LRAGRDGEMRVDEDGHADKLLRAERHYAQPLMADHVRD
jgi:hypothetical protein